MNCKSYSKIQRDIFNAKHKQIGETRDVYVQCIFPPAAHRFIVCAIRIYMLLRNTWSIICLLHILKDAKKCITMAFYSENVPYTKIGYHFWISIICYQNFPCSCIFDSALENFWRLAVNKTGVYTTKAYIIRNPRPLKVIVFNKTWLIEKVFKVLIGRCRSKSLSYAANRYSWYEKNHTFANSIGKAKIIHHENI